MAMDVQDYDEVIYPFKSYIPYRGDASCVDTHTKTGSNRYLSRHPALQMIHGEYEFMVISTYFPPSLGGKNKHIISNTVEKIEIDAKIIQFPYC